MESVLTLHGLKKYAIVRRENRFVVTVKDGMQSKRALLRNTGRLAELIRNGYTALCLDRDVGKTSCEIIGVLVDDKKAALIDPYTQTRVFEMAASKNLIPWLNGWKIAKREVPIGESRIDYKISNATHEGYMELKSAAYCDGYYAMYPDCPSERGLRHINTLEKLRMEGYRAVIAFVTAHPYAKAFKPNAYAHEQLATKLSSVYSDGVEVHAVKIYLDIDGNVFLSDADLPLEL